MAGTNATDYTAIRNTIARYCLALDMKDFNLLKQVFTPDADTIYPFGGQIKGVQNVADAIQKRYSLVIGLTPITSQHALTTQHVEIASDGKTAKATTYFTGIHFGKGKWQGKEVTAWGKYSDELTLFPGQPGLPGSSGQWLISKREVTFMGRMGEEGVMDGE